MREITEIIVHCTATPCNRTYTVEDIDRVHKKKGWKGIGYHYVVYQDGSIHEGRPEEEVGAHCQGHNKHSIGVAYVGGLGKSRPYPPKDTRTDEQKASLIELIKLLKQKYPKAQVHGHNEYAAKACPCFNAFEEYVNI